MSNKISLRYRAAGGAGAGAPPTAGAINGEPAINFDVATNATPELWAFDGTNWKRLNPAAANPTVGSIALPGGTAGSAAGIGAAWTAFTPKPTDPLVIATFGGTAYMKTGSGPADADWTSLGSATTFATNAQVLAGTVTSSAISPAGLQSRTLNAPTATATNDANYIPRLNAQGKIDAGFLTFDALTFRGSIDVTAGAPPATFPQAGDFGVVATAGTPNAAWAAKIVGAGGPLEAGTLLVSDGTNYHAIAQDVSLDSYLPLTGTTAARKMGNAAVVEFDVPAGAAPTTPVVRINGGDPLKSSLDNFTLDGGIF